MALTAAQIAWCRRRLAEIHAREVESARGTTTGRGRIVRYWPDIPKPMHGPVLEFLSNYVSTANSEVVRITEDPLNPCSIPGILGDYVFNQTMANGQPVRTNGTYFLKAVHYEAATSQWQWAVVDNNNFVLFLTELTGDYIAHWADDEDEWKDEWAFEDGQGVLEPASDLPEVPVFEGQTLTMDAAEDHLKVNEYGWVVTDTEATYTVTGSLVLAAVAAQEAVYGVVKTPYVDGTARSGVWSGGEIRMVRTDGSKGSKDSEWVVQQELLQEPQAYLLVGRKVEVDVTEDRRLYSGIAEGQVSDLVAELAVLSSYAVVDVDARKTSRDGVFDIYMTVVTVNASGSYIVVGREVEPYAESETRKYPYIKESEVTATINALTVLGSSARVESSARETRYAGVYHVFVTLRTITASEGDLLVGSSGGLFKSNLYLRRRVADADLPDVVTGLAALSLIENVRSVRTRDEGYWDVFYSQLVVPAARIERKKSHDRKQVAWSVPSAIQHVDDYRRVVDYLDAAGNPVYDYVPCKVEVVTAYSWIPATQSREVSIVNVISYSATDPGDVSASFAGTVSTGGETVQLPNGLWQKTVTTLSFNWWPI